METVIYCECLYCGNKWKVLPYQMLKANSCPKCSDSQIKVRKYQTIDYYGGFKNSSATKIDPVTLDNYDEDAEFGYTD
jgi:DNA-directed RNA polymerase subunit M/transcription elongation factor TFIIS